MFRRRLQIFLGILLAVAAVLLARSVQLQVVQHKLWEDKALASLKQSSYLETNRGEIVDFRGRVMASDVGCIDAAVDYRAIVKDPHWMKEQARQRALKAHPEWTLSSNRRQVLQAAVEQEPVISTDIDAMWGLLAKVSGKSVDDIEQIKSEIVRRVELRRRSIWYARYEKDVAAHERNQQEAAPWYRAWLLGDDNASAPQLDSYTFAIGDEQAAHVILHAIDDETYNKLDKVLARCPGLELKPSAHRVYSEPANVCCAHLLGHLSSVTREDMLSDPNFSDNLRRYFPNDMIGRTGLEGYAEPLLRGTRGQQEIDASGRPTDTIQPIRGHDVRCTIDLDLQWQIMQLFKELHVSPNETLHDLHGAAVVIDVPTGQVRAMVSYPTFDLNQFDADYAELAADDINRPLTNRATMDALEPGSSIKTVIGSWAVSHGYLGVTEGIECTGYLVIDGRKIPNAPRCWTMKMFQVSHHTVPDRAPHRGHDGNADGFLTITDALERSCNVFFETVANRLGMHGVAEAMHDFGLGERTGVGVEEVPGRIPSFATRWNYKMWTWFAGIGQGQVAATPIQMANVAATLARNGIWVRPSLLADANDLAVARSWERERQNESSHEAHPPATQSAPVQGKRKAPVASADEADAVLAGAKVSPAGHSAGSAAAPDAENLHFSFAPRTADRVDLGLTPSALAAVRLGMIRVVNSPAGTGTATRRADMLVAGKTGSAQASKLSRVVTDDQGHKVRQVFEPGAFPWYQGVLPAHPDPNQPPPKPSLVHAWYIGYAPADHPQVAFAVLVEYGGSGGTTAGAIARELLERCVEDGYLQVPSQPPSAAWRNDPDWPQVGVDEGD